MLGLGPVTALSLERESNLCSAQARLVCEYRGAHRAYQNPQNQPRCHRALRTSVCDGKQWNRELSL